MTMNDAPQLTRIVVGVDPAVTVTETSDSTGIVVVGRGPHIVNEARPCTLPNCRGHAFVLEDATCRLRAAEWARRVVECYDYWEADRVVAEDNQGKDLVEEVMRGVRAGLSLERVHSKRGKHLRAEPVVALHEQGRLHFCGIFPKLENELTSYDPENTKLSSPDRMDALVHAVTALDLISGVGAGWLAYMRNTLESEGRSV